ncbi:MAG: sensor histidine kinase [Anaerolineae bacterium]|nr:sensor histidine kinase [Anaerolineae bacterium]MBN8619974.1 sensor histidine kinase [Anaerolineae bacterium]
MNEIIEHVSHLFHFDGILHWCFLIAVFFFVIGLVWVVVRVLIPLRQLAKQTENVMEGHLPTFDTPISGIRELEQLRRSLHFMIGEVKSAQEREAFYRNALTESQENERKRVAREIHDDTIQSLVLVAHSIERAAQPIKAQENPAGEHLENARTQLVSIIDNLRKMIANLRPTILDELGLATAIEVLCEKYPSLEFSVVGDVYDIDEMQELAIFRAAQEAIHNAEQHARAKRITAMLIYSQTGVTLEVRDDGVGFQIPQQLQELSKRGHYGLIGIRERILHLGGQINLMSELAVGTRITVQVPCSMMLG